MNRLAICVAVLMFLGGSYLFAQSSASKVCVSGMQGASGSTSATASRDALLKALEKQKNLKGTTQALDASIHDEALTEAKKKGCLYLLTSNLAEDHTESAYGSGVLMSTTIPTFFVTVTYQLQKVNDGSELSSGSTKAQDTGSQQHAVDYSMNKIASKVGGFLKSGK